MPHPDVTGFVLAGGRSRRMGQDKAQLRWGEKTLVQHAVDLVAGVTRSVSVVGGNEATVSVPAIQDEAIFAGLGPLAGMYAALRRTTTEWNIFLAVDLPLVEPALLELLLRNREAGVLAVVPSSTSNHSDKTTGSLQPLCAVYQCSVLPLIEECLSKRQLSVHGLLERIPSRIMEEEELIAAGCDPVMLCNVNTPADLERAQLLAHKIHGS